MKKLLTILGSVGLVATTSAAVIACGDRTSQKAPDTKPDEKSRKEEEKERPAKEPKKDEEKKEERSKPDRTPKTPESDKTKPSEETRKEDKDKNKQPDDNKEPKENSEQADQPENSEQPKRTKEENFVLIKKYGAEVFSLLVSLNDKFEELYKKPENSELLRLVKNISDLYKKLGRFKTIDEFKNEFNSDKWKNKGSSESFDEFSKELFEQWDKTVTEYEKQKDSILKILKQ